MKTKHPMRGLLTFSFHASLGNASLALLSSIVLLIVFLATGGVFFFNMLVIVSLLMVPMLVISSMGDKDGKWERFQLTMPIKRGDLLGMQYLSVVVSLLIPIALVIGAIGIGPLLHEAPFDSAVSGILATLPALGMPFLMSGLFFPLATTKIGKGKETGLLTTCQFIAIAVILLAPWASERLSISFYMVGALIAAVSALVFLISYFIARVTYAKLDF